MSVLPAYTEEAQEAYGAAAATVLRIKSERGGWQAYEAGKRIIDAMNLPAVEKERRRRALVEALGL